MPTVAETFSRAKTLHGAGELPQAEQLYLQVLATESGHVEARYLHGVACHALGRPIDAISSLEQAVRLKPDFAEAHNQLGLVLAQQGKLDEAAASYRTASKWRPDYVAAHGNLGNVLRRQGKLDEAVSCFERVLALAPNQPAAHNDLGITRQEQGQLDEAASHYRRALEIRPDFVLAHHNLGELFAAQKKFDEAIACYRRAIALQPDFAGSHNGLGSALEDTNRLDEAVACYRQAILLKPDYADAHYNLGLVLARLRQLDEALACQERALELKPDFAEAQFNRGLGLLMTGRFVEGWPGYEWRSKCKGYERPVPPEPCWTGEPLPDKTILLQSEQGLGDTLQFIRYAELVKQRVGRVIVECHASLVRLLAGCAGVDQICASGQPLERFDVYASLASLPGIFGTTLDTVPAKVPYVALHSGLVEQWKHELGEEGRFKIGIAWQGNPMQPVDRFRSLPLAHFSGICRMRGVRVYSLQMGAGREQLAALPEASLITDLGDRPGDLQHTAAIMRNLDLIMVSDSSPAHLAGALGLPVWVALGFVPEWRWLLEREDNPWYPTMRLFRQNQFGDWDDVFQRIERELTKIV